MPVASSSLDQNNIQRGVIFGLEFLIKRCLVRVEGTTGLVFAGDPESIAKMCGNSFNHGGRFMKRKRTITDRGNGWFEVQ